MFVKYASAIWSDEERQEFIAWLAANPEAGNLIPGSGGCRKVRWSVYGRGKRSGARVIYSIGRDGTIWLLIAYTKAEFDGLSTGFLVQLKRGIEDD